MKRLAGLALLLAIMAGCGGSTSVNADPPKRFRITYREDAPSGSNYDYERYLQDTKTGACYFVLVGSYKAAAAPAPKEACEK